VRKDDGYDNDCEVAEVLGIFCTLDVIHHVSKTPGRTTFIC